MGTATALSVAQNLLSALECKELNEMSSSTGYRSQLEKLQHAVMTIKAVLLDAEKRDFTHQAMLFIEQLKDVVYDADDLIDEYLTLAERKQKQSIESGPVPGKVRLLFSHLGVASNMSQQIKEIRNKLETFAADSIQFDLKMDSHPIRRPRDTSLYVYEPHIVGREVDKENIVGMLLDPPCNVPDFLSIVGMGGLGKTALAQIVYNDERICKEFNLRIWVSVSDCHQNGLDLRAVLVKILESTLGQKHDGLTIDELQRQIHQNLCDRKYLLVLDDVWGENRAEWLQLKHFLKQGRNGSKVIVTTRSKETARIVGNGSQYELKGLSDEDSWHLFERTAFGESRDDYPPELIEIGRNIVRKCVGVPLAIRGIGNLLYGQDKKKWPSGQHNGWAGIKGVENPILSPLKLSYDSLTFPLKSCFSYCALFPKDHLIEKDMLIRLWISQGYIAPLHEGRTIEDVAEEYFLILLQRYFFQEVKNHRGYETSFYQIHDLMHDLAQAVAGEEIRVINSSTSSLDDRIRHLSISNGTLQRFDNTKLRTYLEHGPQSPSLASALLKNCTSLRALSLAGTDSESLPDTFGKLVHLRYLDLGGNQSLKALPKSITKLYNLQTLLLSNVSSLKELPKDLSKLTKLRVLDLTGCKSLTQMPPGMSNLSRLHSLTLFCATEAKSSSRQSIAHQLEQLKALRSLKGKLQIQIGISNNTAYLKGNDSEGSYVGAHQHLTEIHFCFSHDGEGDTMTVDYEEALLEDFQPHPNLRRLSIVKYSGMRMPRWINFLPNICEISISFCHSLQYIPSLQILHNLRVLKFSSIANLEYMEDTSSKTVGSSFFPSLEELILFDLPKLKGWWRRDDQQDIFLAFDDNTFPSFPCLSRLSIELCPELTRMPACANLEELKLNVFNEMLQIMPSFGPPQSFPWDSENSKLKMVETDNVKWLNAALPMEGFQCLAEMEIRLDKKVESLREAEEVFRRCSSSLCSLKIWECDRLRTLCGGLEHLTALEKLEIVNVPNLAWSNTEEGEEKDGNESESLPWQSLHSLHSLQLVGLPKLVNLPKGMQFLTSLQSLTIRDCKALDSLPEWTRKLSTLSVEGFQGGKLEKKKIEIESDVIESREATVSKNGTLFTLKSLQKATNNFSRKTMIGQGQFSSCYKGILENGTEVALKVIRGKNQHHKTDTISWINVMSKIRHQNVVEFIGCCFEDDRLIIVYEFVKHSLDRLLHYLNEKFLELSWEIRASICLGVACGIDYLHEGTSPSVVHRDIKPANILLDGKFTPKITDFGIKLLIDDEKLPPREDVGYIDPEYLRTRKLTKKVDVYSFGVLLLEVISSRSATDFVRDSGVTLASWVCELRERGKLMEVVDPMLREFPVAEVVRYIDVALFCVQESSDDRPSMSEALQMLSESYDFSKKVPMKPGNPRCSNTYVEVESPASGNKSEKKEITAVSGDGSSTMHVSESPQESVSTSASLKRGMSDPITAKKGKMIQVDEIEIESDVTESDEAGLMQLSYNLETEKYKPTDPNVSAVPESGPSDETVVRPETKSASTGTDVVLQKDDIEAAGKTQTSGDPEAELYRSSEPDSSDSVTMSGPGSLGPSLEKLVNPEISAQLQIEIEELPIQAEASQENEESLSLTNLNLQRPIHSTVEKILESFRDGHCRRICLYGRGGSGKTKVLETLFHHPAVKSLFDRVIFLTVHPRLAYRQNVQNEKIQLLLDVESLNAEDGITALVRLSLTGQKVLLLLDDVQETINLHEIGIPDLGPQNRCWLLLATRSLDVCLVMADREVEMEVLSTAEAWELFRVEAGAIVDCPEIKPYARAISEKCSGVSLIISAVASALRVESSVVEWELAQQNIELSNSYNTENQYLSPQIKYCYDRLKTRDLKTCFLYCALFARDIEVVDIPLLVGFFIKEGLLGGESKAAYEKGVNIVKHLVNSALLEVSANGLAIKMHNVIRDSALAILSSGKELVASYMSSRLDQDDETSADGLRTKMQNLVKDSSSAILSSGKEAYQVLVRYHASPIASEADRDVQISGESGSTTMLVDRQDSSSFLSPSIHRCLTRVGLQVKEAPPLKEWEQATMIFLTDSGLSSLPIKPNCPNLVALCLQRNTNLRVIPSSFFERMFTLRLLNLSKTKIKSLPGSFYKLKSLQVLVLRDCERFFELPTSIGDLKSLEVLDLQGTKLSQLPSTLGELVSLKQLRVSFYGTINPSEYKNLPTKLIPDGAISGLELTELGIFLYPGDPRWILSVSDIINEVNNLNLSTLYFHFPEVEHLKRFLDGNQSWIRKYLSTFNFVVGRDFKHNVSQVSYDAELMFSEEERCLRYVNGDNIPDAVAELLTRVTSFYLDHHLSISNLLEFGIDRMLAMKICILRDCPQLEAVVNVKEHTEPVLPYLEYLSIDHLWNLESLWVGRALKGSLARLRHLTVHGCTNLKYVLTSSMLDMLLSLEELVIEDCEAVEFIVVQDADVDDDPSNTCVDTTVVSDDQIIASLDPVLHSLKVLKLHCLPELCGVWKGCWPLHLQSISLYDCPRLKNLHMNANDVMHIKEIAAEKDWWDELDWDDSAVSRRLHESFTEISN